jgi:HTH-type transcriptional regulator, sugar sensing transcriptional regulator
MDRELLRSIGLTDSEIKVYMALLELGSSSKGPIVDRSSVASSKIYELLEKLQHKGLVSSVVRSGVKYFEAASPTRLLDYMQEKERSLKEKKLELKSLIPELELKRSMAGIGSETQVFKGMKGAATSFDDILRTLKKDDEYYVFGISQFSPHFERFVVNFHKKRAKLGIKCKVIVNQLAKDIGEKLEPIALTKVKYIQKELFTPFVFIIYADKVLISIGLDEVFIQVKSEKLASGLKRYADHMWEQDVAVSRGIDGIHVAWDNMLSELNPGEEYYVLGASWRGQKKEVYDYFVDFHNRRQKKKVKVKFLFVSGTQEMLDKYKKSYGPLSEFKFLPEGVYEGMQINLYKGKVLMFVWKEDEPIVFTIDDSKVYETFRTYFDTLWQQDVKVSKGFDGMKQALQSFLDSLEEGETWDVLGATFGADTKKFANIFMDIHQQRLERGVKGRMLFEQSATPILLENKEHERYQKTVLNENNVVRHLPYKTASPVAIFPSEKKTLLVIQEKEPTVITIDNKDVSQAFKNHFEQLWDPETKVLKGLDAIQQIFEEMLEAGHCDFIGARGYFVDKRPEYAKDWERRAKAKGFTMRNVVDPSVKGHKITQFPFVDTKYTLKKEFSTLSVFWIFGDKVVISNWMEKEGPIVVVINNKNLHAMYKQQFETLWDQR